MTTRREARRLAIDVLYQADITDRGPSDVLRGWREADREVPAFTEELVDGVGEHGPEIDLLLEEHAEGWTVSRMTALDRTILRVAVEELLPGGRAAVGGDQRSRGGGVGTVGRGITLVRERRAGPDRAGDRDRGSAEPIDVPDPGPAGA